MANLNFTSWLSSQGLVKAVKWAILVATANTAKPTAAIGEAGAIPASWSQLFTLSEHDLTINTTDAQFDERIYGINQKVVTKALLRSPSEQLTFNVDDFSVYAQSQLLIGDGTEAVGQGSPVTATTSPRYVSEGIRKAVTFVGFSLHDDYEIQWYLANALITYRDVKDGNAWKHSFTVDPVLQTNNNLNYYRYETVYPSITT